MPAHAPKPVTALAAERHEALYVRLAALTKQTEAIATRRPAAGVPEAVRILAEGLLFDARPFLARRPRGKLPVAASVYGGLAAQLGQALAVLDAFEARHARWDPARKCFVWCLAGDGALPVRRLRPQTSAIGKSPGAEREMAALREKLKRRLISQYDEGFAAGLRAATEPPTIRE